MKKITLLLCVFVTSIVATAQELNLPSVNQYLADSDFLLAPTFAGIGNNVRVRASGVAQWIGIKDAPAYQSLGGDMRMGDRSGLGLLLYNDKNGYTKQMGGKFTFSHHLTMDRYDKHFVSFGISYIVNSFKIDIDRFTETGRPLTDPAVTDGRSVLNHNFEVGALYRYKGAWISLAASNILNKDKDIFNINEPTALRNYNLYAGYTYRKNNTSDWEFEPSAFMQYFESDGRSSTDINFKVRWYDFEDYYWAGITYRFLNDQILEPLNVGPVIGLKKNVFYFAYGYQVILNELAGHNSGTHMITIGMDFFQGIGGCNCTEK